MLTRAELKQNAKQQLKGNWGIAILAVIIFYIVLPLLGFIPFAGIVAGILLGAPLIIGLMYVFLQISKAQKVKAEDIFYGFGYYGKSIWLYILIAVFTFLWSLLLIVPGIVKSISYSMSYFIVAENPALTAREALDRSKIITMGHKGEIFVLGLSFIWWYLLVGVTCGIASLYVCPYVQATFANYYNQIKGEPVIVNEEPDTPDYA